MVDILDNLNIHSTKKLEEDYEHDFKEMFLLTYSSELNPIESNYGHSLNGSDRATCITSARRSYKKETYITKRKFLR